MIQRVVLVALMLGVSVPVGATDLTNDGLRKLCTKKTIVYNRQGDRVGEKLDEYCSAYLLATLDALRNLPGSECKNTDEKAPEYLLTVYETFSKEKKVSAAESASKTLLQAYRRAFDCRASQ